MPEKKSVTTNKQKPKKFVLKRFLLFKRPVLQNIKEIKENIKMQSNRNAQDLTAFSYNPRRFKYMPNIKYIDNFYAQFKEREKKEESNNKLRTIIWNQDSIQNSYDKKNILFNFSFATSDGLTPADILQADDLSEYIKEFRTNFDKDALDFIFDMNLRYIFSQKITHKNSM